MGVSFHPVALRGGKIDLDAVENAITPKTKLVIAQRSRGYDWRPSLMPEEFAPLAKMLHEKHPGVRLMVDNCYGEFVCEKEPSHYGADVCVGSLIKNPGGGLAPTGGYIVGYIPMVALAGFLMSKSDKWWLHLLAMVAGEVVLYLIGTVWFCVQAGKTASAALAICVYPFIPLDIVKMVIVVLIGPMISSRLKKAHLNV